ncbi:MAG: hypothetical protein ACOVRB_00175 [Akkermansiaceae bacterium]
MKIDKIITLLTMMSAMGNAQVFNATAQNVTFALVDTYAAPALIAKNSDGTTAKDENDKPYLSYYNEYTQQPSANRTVSTYEYSSKMVASKISNREILEELVEQGVIQTIIGYSIVFVYSQEQETGSFVLRKKNEQDEDISSIIQLGDTLASAAAESGKEVTTTVSSGNGDPTETSVASGKASGKDVFQMKLGEQISFTGVFAWSDTLKTFKDKETDETYTLWIPGASKVTGINGAGPSDEDGESSVIEGGVSMSPGIPETL